MRAGVFQQPVRDPEGGIACYHSTSMGRGFITSDVGLSIRLGMYKKKIDWEHIAQRLKYPQLKTSHTGFAQIDELLPGLRLLISKKNTISEHTWNPWTFVEASQRYRHLAEAAENIRHAVDMVVDSWSHTDRKILLELSGGLDSSILGSSLQHAGASFACATYMTPLPGGDERLYSQTMANHLGIPLDIQHLPLDVQFHFARGIFLPTIRVGALQNVADTLMEDAALRHDATSHFSGAGGDTVFCNIFTASPAADALREKGLVDAITAAKNLADLHQCTLWRAVRLTIKKIAKPPLPPYAPSLDLLGSGATSCHPEQHPWLKFPPSSYPGDRERITALAVSQIYRDGTPRGFTRYLRFPLLSQPVMEATLRTPTWMWISGGRDRAAARQAYNEALPSLVLDRKSKGSFTPYMGSLLDRNRAHLKDFLLNGELSSRDFINHDAVHGFLDTEATPRNDSFEQILDLCTVENWVRHHV